MRHSNTSERFLTSSFIQFFPHPHKIISIKTVENVFNVFEHSVNTNGLQNKDL